MNILEQFEKVVKAQANNIAVCDENEQLSFNELKDKALSLASSLSFCANKNQAIGIFIDRSIYSIVAMIATLYSGNYYVPLDPKMPTHKLKSIIEETKMPAILVHDNCLDDINYSGEVINIRTDYKNKLNYDLNNFDDNNPLYMVYTSGSTGKPKGVLKSHKAMSSFMNTYATKYHFDDKTIIGNQSPFFFDAAAKDLYMMMLVGAKMVIIPTILFSMPYKLIEYLNDHQVNFISWVPSMLSMIVQLNTFDDITPKYLKRVFFVGESFPIKHLNKWLTQLPSIEYVNLFGSSEVAGVFATYEVKKIKENQNFLPIGKALDNCKVLLVNDDGIVDKANELSEIVISSDAVALCYYKDEAKTKEKFIETDKYTGKKERFFITGDIASYDENGNIVFVTRKDFQIKKMGYRIELGEIEAIANKYEPMKMCCATYNQEKKKISLFCEVSDPEITKNDIKNYLKDNLPDYMMPDKFKILDKLPLNANGKIDRAYLKSLA